MRTTWSRRAVSTQPQPAVRGQVLHGARRRCRVEQLVRARGDLRRVSLHVPLDHPRGGGVSAGKFGAAFDDYCRRVPRWWPRFAGLGRTLAESDFHWARVFVKEYSAPLGWVLPIVAFGLYNMKQTGDSADQPLRTGVLLGVLGADHALLARPPVTSRRRARRCFEPPTPDRASAFQRRALSARSARVVTLLRGARTERNSRSDWRSQLAAAANAGSFDAQARRTRRGARAAAASACRAAR